MEEKSEEEIVMKYTLKNAVEHNGHALVNSVMTMLITAYPAWRTRAKEIKKIVEMVVEKVNKMKPDEQKKELEKYGDLKTEVKKQKEGKDLPELPGAIPGKVVMRFAPNPDFIITLGNARPAILNYIYAKRYDGKFILRYDDTDVKIKTPLPEVYEKIREDLEWLGIIPDEIHYQSKRLEIYYKYGKDLIDRGHAYVCTCSKDDFQKYKNADSACPHRDAPVEKNIELWNEMLSGGFGEEEATLRIKTGVDLEDTSLREWVAFRIVDTSKNPHPITGDKYNVWPTYNFACAIDDYEMGITHILRAKEHEQNAIKQEYIYKYMGWKYPVAIHFGRLGFSGITLSKSKIRHTLESAPGKYLGYDDPRFGTISGLRRRGFVPEAIREIIIQCGIKESYGMIAMENLVAINKKYVDPRAKRIMFVEDPILVEFSNVESLTATLPLNPSNAQMGKREVKVKNKVYIAKEDAETLKKLGRIRLFQLANLRYVSTSENSIIAECIPSHEISDVLKEGIPIVQWVPFENARDIELLIPEGDELLVKKGKVESFIDTITSGEIVQLLRICFARIEKNNSKIMAFFTHK
ncbi:MAG: glutamate--tRNA ligase [Candidatus Korarchaeota archaeon]